MGYRGSSGPPNEEATGVAWTFHPEIGQECAGEIPAGKGVHSAATRKRKDSCLLRIVLQPAQLVLKSRKKESEGGGA
jgi:hypothetical protein